MLRLAAVLVGMGVAWAAVATKAAHHDGRIDEAGVVLIGVCSLGVLLVSSRMWAHGGVQLALAGLPPRAVPVESDRRPAGLAGGRTSDSVLDVESITVRYGTRVALDDVSFTVGSGEIVGLLGPNGAGKTTMVDVCSGLRKPDAGRVSLMGYDATVSGRDLRRAIGVVPQETGLYPELTAAEYLRLFAAMYDLKATVSARVEELLRLMGLWDRRNSRVAGFSGGMKRRLALARALLHDPPVLFLDEPTLGVDVHGRRALWEHVAHLRDEGRSVLLTTNYLEEATALCDRVVILDKGVVLEDADPAELRGRSGTVLHLETPEPALVANAVQQRHGLTVQADEGRVSISLPRDDQAADVVRTAASVADVTSIRTEQPTLEEVFLRLTGRGLRE